MHVEVESRVPINGGLGARLAYSALLASFDVVVRVTVVRVLFGGIRSKVKMKVERKQKSGCRQSVVGGNLASDDG